MLPEQVRTYIQFLAYTDVNSDSLQDAYRNVQHNGATDRITLLQTAPEDDFFAAALRTTPQWVTHACSWYSLELTSPSVSNSLDFTMCNPPFYASDEEMQRLTEDKDLPPHAVSWLQGRTRNPGGLSERLLF